VDGPPMSSPYVQNFQDNFGKFIRITVTFNNNTRAINGCTIVRDVGCQWRTIYIGIGPDGTPNTSPNAFTVPTGTTNVGAAALASRGLNTLEDVTALQITAGP
jgi:hypothetical protein